MKQKKVKPTEYTQETENVEAKVETETEVVDDANKLPPNVEKIKGRWWLPYLITFAVLAVFTVAVGWARGGFGATTVRETVRYWCDAFCVSGLLGVCFGLLVVVSNGGAFDMLGYGIRRLFGLFKKDPLDRKYGGYYEYQQAKKAKKRSFWYLIIVGAVYLLVGLVLLIVYYKV